MIFVERKRLGLSYPFIWYGDKPKLKWAWRPTFYQQPRYKGNAPGYVKKVKQTSMIDLEQSLDEIKAGMTKSTRYNVNRATKDGARIEMVDDLQEFISFYDRFARDINQPCIDPNDIPNWGKNTVAMAVSYEDGTPSTMAAFVIDHESGIAQLYHSASHFREKASRDERSAIGRANRFLHFKAMGYFKEWGLKEYDLGGLPQDPALKGIREFKTGFGGDTVTEYNYMSYTLYALKLVQKLLKRETYQ